MLVPLRRTSRSFPHARALPSISTRGAFLLRLLGTFSGVLVLVAAGLFVTQSQDARRVAIADGTERQLARGEVIENTYAAAAQGPPAEGPGWDAVKAALNRVVGQHGVRQAVLISPSGDVVAGSGAAVAGTELPASDVARLLRTGEPVFAARFHQGREVHQYLSRVRLGGERYVLAVNLDPSLLTSEAVALRSSSLRELAVGVLLAIPLLYLLGGRSLARRFGAAVDQATLDRLTGLPDHWSFQESLEQEIARAQHFREAFTLALLDIDDFAFVNDSRGRQKGDELLVNLADALFDDRHVDRTFRIGGDEFALILPNTPLADATRAVELLRGMALGRLEGTTVSIGLAAFAPAGSDSDAATRAAVLRDHADRALAEAKHRGRNGVVTFAELAQAAPLRTGAATITAVRHLLATRQMGAAFQPIWNLDTHRVFGYEALARPSVEYQLDGPRDAFSGAARLDRIAELDALCRESILARAGTLPEDLLLFLNISPSAFGHTAGFGERLRDEVEAAGLDPRQIVLELTEHARGNAGTGRAMIAAPVQELRDLGFHLALDNVGSGESGLGLLGKVRPDYVKVDRAIVRSARDGGPGRAVLAAIVAYAAASGAVVIAEGIETEDILHHLERAGRTVSRRARFVGGQGYLLGRPDAEPPWHKEEGLIWPLPHELMKPHLMSAS